LEQETRRESAVLEPPGHAGVPHRFTVERQMNSPAAAIYRAWTEEFDSWFATPGHLSMRPQAGTAWYFEVVHDGIRRPHYGRFLVLEPGRLVETTWLTGKGGTEGAETVVRVELASNETGTHLRLSHGGFGDHEAARRHADSWPAILEHLDESLSRRADPDPTAHH
jgi:uncharacterized protein YndB with AHSA1/START domain